MSKKILLGAICTVLFCGTSATVFAQDNAPSGAASSLLNSADPRAAGMGMATTAVNDNPFGIFGNAASNLLSEKRMGFGYSYNPVMPDYNTSFAGIVGCGAILLVVFGASRLFRAGQKQG